MPRLIMPRLAMMFFVVALAFIASSSLAQTPTKPTAPEKMTSPAEAKKMRACEALAAQRNVKMDERAKFVMACMTAQAK
jgi:hypothetical protein